MRCWLRRSTVFADEERHGQQLVVVGRCAAQLCDVRDRLLRSCRRKQLLALPCGHYNSDCRRLGRKLVLSLRDRLLGRAHECRCECSRLLCVQPGLYRRRSRPRFMFGLSGGHVCGRRRCSGLHSLSGGHNNDQLAVWQHFRRGLHRMRSWAVRLRFVLWLSVWVHCLPSSHLHDWLTGRLHLDCGLHNMRTRLRRQRLGRGHVRRRRLLSLRGRLLLGRGGDHLHRVPSWSDDNRLAGWQHLRVRMHPLRPGLRGQCIERGHV